MSANCCFTNIKHPEDAKFIVTEELEKATTNCSAAPFTNFGTNMVELQLTVKGNPIILIKEMMFI